jgi:nicotinamidase/pyrazinamidase
VGLTTDYCVKTSVLDACSLGICTTCIEDACRPVNLKPTDGAAALEEMRRAGALVKKSSEI